MEFTGERYIPVENSRDELSVEHLHRYYSILPLIKDKTVLDIACGEGYGAALIAKAAKNVIGVDISKECIEHAVEKYFAHYPNIRFLEGKAEKIPADDDTFDVVVSFETIEHLSEEGQQQFLTEVKRVLKSNGIFIVSTPDKENYSDRYQYENHFHIHELNRKEFINLIDAYFNNAQLMEQGFDIISSITPEDSSTIESVRLINWQEKVQPKKRKYVLAIASDQPVDGNAMASVVLETDKDYFKQVDRILELQREVEDRSAWALHLDQQRIQHEAIVHEQQQAIDHHVSEATRLKSSNQELLEQIAKLKEQLIEQQSLQEKNHQLEAKVAILTGELKEKEQILQDVQFNFSLTKQQLSEVNNRLLTIYDSEGWKVLEKYYTFKGKYLNEDSKHYKLLKRTVNFLRNKKEPLTATSSNKSSGKNEGTVSTENVQGRKEIAIRSLPYFEQPVVSIIIPVYNAWEMNEKCLTAIIEHTKDVAYEVIIADDGSTDETKEISKYFENIVHIRNEKNLGFLLNCNHASTFARGRYLHFLNNDTEVKSGWLSSLIRLFENDDLVGLAGSKLIYPDGRLQEAGGIIWNDASGWNYGQGQNPEMPEFNYVKETDYVSGASMMIRTSLWKEIGGFDVRYSPAYCEDSDLAFTVREKGFKVLFQPLSEVVHYEGYSHGNDREKSAISSIKEYQYINNQKFFEKWKAVLQKDHFPNAAHVFWAKERSRSKKTLLMVDHYVPQFDKDAGSRTTFQYLQLFLKLGFNIKFLGENFYKHEPYTTVLQQMGIEVLYGPWYRDNWQQWFKENNEKFDYIYLNRPHVSINFIDFFKQHSKARIIYYGHDLHFLREQKRYEIEKDEAVLKQVQEWKKIEMYLFSNSDIILTPSIDEKQVIQSLNSEYNVQLMRPFIYKTVNRPQTLFKERKDLLFVGGFGHLPNVDGVLWFAKEVWPSIRNQIPGIRFLVAGSHPPQEIKNLASENIVIKGYVADDELERLYATCKLAVIPLRYGAGVKGKTVEAMRYGIPLVTTSFGVEGLPGDYSFLRVSDSAAAFAAAIGSIYNNEELLCELSKKSVEYIENHFTESVAADIIMNAFTSLKSEN